MPTILGANQLDTGYEIDNGLVFNGANQWMTHTRGTATDEKLFTFSAWIKLGQAGILENGAIFGAGDDGNGYVGDAFMVQTNGLTKQGDHDPNTDNHNVRTNALLRDPAAWYHVVVAADSTQGTSSNRIKIYVNGTQQTDLAASTYPSQNITFDCNTNGQVLNIGRVQNGENRVYWDGYMSEINFIDGQQLDPSYFAETNDNGVWIPKKYTGTYGNNGFFLEFKQTGTSANASGIGADTSGNGNHFAVNNIGSNQPTIDTPTNNYCVLNQLYKAVTGSTNKPTITGGNISVARVADSSTQGTFGVDSGKWYFEVRYNSGQVDGYPQIGYSKAGNVNNGQMVGFHTPSGSDYRGKVAGNVISNAFSGTISSNDILGFYMDLDNGNLKVYKNGSDFMGSGASSGLDFSSASFSPDTGFFHVHYNTNANSAHSEDFNFGGTISFTVSSSNADANGHGKFEYSPTIGGVNYYALNSKNLAEFG